MQEFIKDLATLTIVADVLKSAPPLLTQMFTADLKEKCKNVFLMYCFVYLFDAPCKAPAHPRGRGGGREPLSYTMVQHTSGNMVLLTSEARNSSPL